MFSDQQLQQLRAPLDEGRIHTRKKQGIELRYVEGFDCIDRANEIFGFHAWSYQMTKLELQAGVWIATVLLTVTTPTGESVGREDVGVGIPAAARGTDASPDAHETAIKGAVTDAMKRALRTFGNAWGNSLYDKDAPHAPATEERQERTKDAGNDAPSRVWDRLKALMEERRYDRATFEAQCKGYLHDVLRLEKWDQLAPAQWRDFERAMATTLTGQAPARPGPDGTWESIGPSDAEKADAPPSCPTCGAPMNYKEGTNKAGKAYAGYFCADRNCKQTPIWTGGR